MQHQSQKRIIASSMKLLYFLADAFVNTFGITRPTDKGRKQAAFFILGLIVFAVALAATAGVLVHSVMH
jgi:hypothetical protein